jgi:hypothetical protein
MMRIVQSSWIKIVFSVSNRYAMLSCMISLDIMHNNGHSHPKTPRLEPKPYNIALQNQWRPWVPIGGELYIGNRSSSRLSFYVVAL